VSDVIGMIKIIISLIDKIVRLGIIIIIKNN